MKAIELKLEKKGYNFSANVYPARSHYKDLMCAGRVLPTTTAQAKFYVSTGCVIDLLNYDDVKIIESLLNKHGFEGNYKYSKSNVWVRLENHYDLVKALKLEFNI